MKKIIFSLLLLSTTVLAQMPSQSCYEDLFPKQAENKFWGYVNLFDEWKVEPVFSKIFPFIGNKALVEKQGRFGVVGCDGKMVVPADFEEIGPLANGSNFWVKKAGKWSLANEKGELLSAGNVSEIKEVAGMEVTWLQLGEDNYGLYHKRKLAFIAQGPFALYQILSDKASLVLYKEKFGILSNTDGTYLFEPVITAIRKLSPQVIAFQEKGKWGILSPQGEVRKVAELDSIGFILNNLFYAKQEGKSGLINSGGKPILPLEYEEVNPFYEHMSLIKRNGMYGYTNLAGNVTVPIMYEWGDNFQNDQTIVKTNAGYFIIDKTNKKLTLQTYKWLVKTRHRDYYAAHRDGKYLFLNLTGHETTSPRFNLVVATDTLPFVRVKNDTTHAWNYFNVGKSSYAFKGDFDEASSFNWGLAFVKKNNAWGAIDQKGETKVAFQYTALHYLTNNNIAYIVVEQNNKKGLLSSSGTSILPIEYDLIASSSNGLLKVKKDGKYAILRVTGEETGKAKYDGLSNSLENPALPEWPSIILKKKKYGLLAQNQTEIVEPDYSDISYLGDNLYVAVKDNKKAMINSAGKVLVQPIMEDLRPQSEKYLPFKQEGKWGYVFNTGQVMIVPTYEEAGAFYKNLALVKQNGKWGAVNKQGRWLVKAEFETVTYLANNKRRLKSASKEIEITEKGIVKQLD